MILSCHCANCGDDIPVMPSSPLMALLEEASAAGPWVALGDGETFEDQLRNDLSNATPCPECGQPVSLSEDSLTRFSRELLLQW
jgi:endogenous inhibitor of DNA gyrase (YacG/DUF329 family)